MKAKAKAKDESLGDVAVSTERMDDGTLYRLYDTTPHIVYKEGVTITEIGTWYQTKYNPGFTVGIEFVELSPDVYGAKVIEVRDIGSGKPIGLMCTMDTYLESGYRMPENAEFMHNPNYVPPVVKNVKGKAPKGMN